MYKDIVKCAPEWMTRWGWADEYVKYNGPQDLKRWFEWIGDYSHFLDPAEIDELSAMSKARNEEVFRGLGLGTYNHGHVDRYSATDIVFMNRALHPFGYKTVLDFGAGYGRQANLLSQTVTDLRYIAMDAVEGPWELQSLYMPFFGPVNEFTETGFSIDTGLNHVPSWKADFIPNASVDAAMLVQVVQELPEQVVVFLADTLGRVVRPGGFVYIRDDKNWKPSHQLDFEATLIQRGFFMDWQPTEDQKPKVHGIPRIIRKI